MRPYMTEEQAAKKFCPLADCGSDGNRAMNGKPQDYNRCFGSDCMFWGWEALTSCPGEGQAPRTFASTTKGRCEAPGGAA